MKKIWGLSALLLLSACDPAVDRFENEAKLFVRHLMIDVFKVTPPETLNVKASPTPGSVTSSEMAKANSEILLEVYQVTYDETEVDSREKFGELVNSLNGGASIEGVYRGIVMGNRYRGLEAKGKAASPALLKAFAIEMAELQSTMVEPTVFSPDTAKSAPTIDYPDGSEAPAATPSQEVKAKDRDQAVKELVVIFLGATPFTLKRALADEALKKMDELKDSPAEFAQWYARFVVRMCDARVDFGLPQRNNPNPDFHVLFAKNMASDRVKWEVLNRYHRYLNAVLARETSRPSDTAAGEGDDAQVEAKPENKADKK